MSDTQETRKVSLICGYDADGNEVCEDDLMTFEGSDIQAKAVIFKCFLYPGDDKFDCDWFSHSNVKAFGLRLIKEKNNE